MCIESFTCTMNLLQGDRTRRDAVALAYAQERKVASDDHIQALIHTLQRKQVPAEREALFLSATQDPEVLFWARQLDLLKPLELHGSAVCHRLFWRCVNPWELTFDAMDGCFIACSGIQRVCIHNRIDLCAIRECLARQSGCCNLTTLLTQTLHAPDDPLDLCVDERATSQTPQVMVCPICIERVRSVVLACSHTYCAQCTRKLNKKCAVCNQVSESVTPFRLQ